MLTEMEIKVQRVLFDNYWNPSESVFFADFAFKIWLRSYEANKIPEMKPAQPLTTYTYEYED